MNENLKVKLRHLNVPVTKYKVELKKFLCLKSEESEEKIILEEKSLTAKSLTSESRTIISPYVTEKRQSEKILVSRLTNDFDTLYRVVSDEDAPKRYSLEQEIHLECFKKEHLNIEPSYKMWEILTEEDIKIIFNLSKRKRKGFIESKLGDMFGYPKLLFTTLLYSIILYAEKHNYSITKIQGMITILCRCHQYFLYNPYITPDDIYAYFKEYLKYFSTDLPSVRKKIFTICDCVKITEYFVRVYVRNMPLVRILMLPNFALKLNYTLPVFEEFETKGKKKK